MIDYYLKFDTFTKLQQAIDSLGMSYLDQNNNYCISQGDHSLAICLVGEIPGHTGYHLNIRVINPDISIKHLESYIVTPAIPYSVWA